MDIKNKLLAYGKKSITLEALTDLLKADPADTKGLYDRISELAGASILEPVKNSGQNGNRKYPLFKKYRIMIKEESSEEVEKQIRQLHPALQRTGCSIIGKENLTLNEIHGEVPFLRFYSTEKEMTAIVEGFLERMKKGEVPADKITILSASTLDNSFIDAKRKYAGFELSEKREPGKVHFTTIRKFKGLEAEAILVVDASMIGLKSEEDRRLLYVGVSRAKNYLERLMRQVLSAESMEQF